MNGTRETFGSKLLKVISTIAAICTILGVSVAGLFSLYFGRNNDINISVNTEDYKLNDEQNKVNHYVLLCKDRIIPLEEWDNCTDIQLYHIRNGIYAYEGRCYKGNYFKVFDWYNGHILPKDFKDGYLNYFQNRNIANIIKVEEKRKAVKNRKKETVD